MEFCFENMYLIVCVIKIDNDKYYKLEYLKN